MFLLVISNSFMIPAGSTATNQLEYQLLNKVLKTDLPIFLLARRERNIQEPQECLPSV